MPHWDVIIIGAGGAGVMCAAQAARRGRRVTVLDHAAEVGAKILISGGGRCNFTNVGVAPERYVSANPHFARSALSRYTSADFIALVSQHGIAYHEKKLGQLFCDRSARQIVELLVGECRDAGATLQLATQIHAVNNALTQRLTSWSITPTGTVGYSKAEVTRGGISTDELSSKTMETKKVPGLYCIGEVVDVTGWLGGYNFQWAWSSGWVAGQYA